MLHHCMWHHFIGTHLRVWHWLPPDLCHVTPQEVCRPGGRDRMACYIAYWFWSSLRPRKVNAYLDIWIADISIITKALFSLIWRYNLICTLQTNINDGLSKRYEDSVDVHAVLRCRRLCNIQGTPYKSAHNAMSLYGKEIKSMLI